MTADVGSFKPPNVWMGVSVESPAQLYRVENLRAVPAAVRFLSCEPLLAALGDLDLAGIGWVIAGGECGRAYRPVAAAWVRQLRDGCGRQSVPFFFELLCTNSPYRQGLWPLERAAMWNGEVPGQMRACCQRLGQVEAMA